MPVEVLELNDSVYGAEFVSSELGNTAKRVYLVGTPDFAHAPFVTGVPQLGAAYSAEHTTTLLRSARAELWTGPKPNPLMTDVVGAAKVTCEYSTPGLSSWGEAIPPESRFPGASYSEYEYGDASVTVFSDINDNRPINQGRGASVEASVLEVRVRAFRLAPPPIASFLPFLNTINAADFSIPPMFGTSQALIIPAGAGLFRTPRVTVTRGPESGPGAPGGGAGTIVEVMYRFGVAPSWKIIWQEFDEDGEPILSAFADGYRTVNWGTIF